MNQMEMYKLNQANILKYIKENALSMEEISSLINLSISAVAAHLKEIEKSYIVEKTKINFNKPTTKYYSIGFKPKSFDDDIRDKIETAIRSEYLTIDDITNLFNIPTRTACNYVNQIASKIKVDKILKNGNRNSFAYGINLGFIKFKYNDLPPKITDLYLIKWADKRPEFYNKSTREIIDIVKNNGIQVYRKLFDGNVYAL